MIISNCFKGRTPWNFKKVVNTKNDCVPDQDSLGSIIIWSQRSRPEIINFGSSPFSDQTKISPENVLRGEKIHLNYKHNT